MIEQNIKLYPEKCHVRYKYLIIRDLSKLGDNLNQVVAIKIKVEARLTNKGVLEEYNKDMKGYLKHGAFREITEQEIKD